MKGKKRIAPPNPESFQTDLPWEGVYIAYEIHNKDTNQPEEWYLQLTRTGVLGNKFVPESGQKSKEVALIQIPEHFTNEEIFTRFDYQIPPHKLTPQKAMKIWGEVLQIDGLHEGAVCKEFIKRCLRAAGINGKKASAPPAYSEVPHEQYEAAQVFEGKSKEESS